MVPRKSKAIASRRRVRSPRGKTSQLGRSERSRAKGESLRVSRKKTIKKSLVKKIKISRNSVKPRGLKLVSIKKSTRPDKKLMATFSDGTITHFGAKGYQNYGGVGKERHLDKERRDRYIERHKARENWKDPRTAGSLSRWVLWNKETLKASIDDFKHKFKL
jgi:hypothetical protein